jgi:hypothetical protein
MTLAPCKRFMKVWLFGTVASLAGIAAFNVLVDPRGAYPALHLRCFEPLRYLSYDRVDKAEMARRGGWETIILGSSRSRAGLPAVHPLLFTNQTCNLSLDAARFPELLMALDYARKHNPLRRVILCVDLYMFTRGERWLLDFPESRFNPDFERFPYHCKLLFGLASTSETWTAIRRKLEGYAPPPQSQRGFLNAGMSPGRMQRELFSNVLHQMGAGYSQQSLDPACLEFFRELVRTCRDQHLELQVAILPVHAVDIELLYSSGRWPEFERWKAGMVNVLAEEGVEDKFPLWDFTGYSGPTAEPVPPWGDVTTRMKYYYENSHFTPALGSLMLEAMYGSKGTNDFGVKLSRSNLTAHLAGILQDRAAYALTNANEIQWVERILSEVTAPRH